MSAYLACSAELTGHMRFLPAVSAEDRVEVVVLDKGQRRLGLDAQSSKHGGGGKGCVCGS